MTDSKIVEAVLAGRMPRGAEWRSAEASLTKTFDDKGEETGVKRKVIKHQVEFEGKPFVVQQEMTEAEMESLDCDKWNAAPKPFKKGDFVIVLLKSFGWSNFKKTFSGKGVLTPYEGKLKL